MQVHSQYNKAISQGWKRACMVHLSRLTAVQAHYQLAAMQP